MKLAAIHASKVSALVEATDLVPLGKIFLPDLIAALAAKCEFRKVPEGVGKQSPPADTVFEVGKWNDQPILKLTLYRDGIVLETGSSTEDTEAALEQMLLWAKDEIGIFYETEMIKRKAFYSQVAVYFDTDLNLLHPILGEIASAVSESTSTQIKLPMDYRTAGITIGTNTLTAKFPTGVFTIERRLDVPDSENKYFSSAPLRTFEHLALLERFEKSLRK